MIHSVHDVLSTRLCAARDCANDAENGWALCAWCERRRLRGHPIPLHITPPQLPDMLRCNSCNQWKPDEDFPMISKAQARTGGRNPGRRGRYCNCRACEKRKRRERRDKHANAQLEGSDAP